MEKYLKSTDVIDWDRPEIIDLAGQIAADETETIDIARACFEWVRDEIFHSVDYQMNPLTCRATDVLKYRTGYCFAKSHLLAALLRANRIPTGFCYQRLSFDDVGAPYTLHGFNAIYLPEIGWYRVDARGNKEGVNARFDPPHEYLAYPIKLAAEIDFPVILADPLPIVIAALRSHVTWDDFLGHIPDLTHLPAEDERE